MKFATYEWQGSICTGVVQDDLVLRLPTDEPMEQLVRLGLAGLLEVGRRAIADGDAVSVRDIRLRPPLKPPSIRDFVAFEAHVEGVVRAIEGFAETPKAWYPRPQFYFTNPHAAYGAHDDVPFPPNCTFLDFETEVGMVIGQSGSNLTPAEGDAAIIGLTIFNDWSARDLQRPERELGLGFAKSKDSANTLGPWLVTIDEFEDLKDSEGFYDITMRAYINDELIGEDSMASMSWTPGELVAYASRGTWVQPGDILGSGTCGNGCLVELHGRHGKQEPALLQPGDSVTIEIERIGSIRNTVVPSTAEVHEIPSARKRTRGVRH
jgi:2-keto-4-pentenoate hydratase/2-oxohepta-3-ene-1,7-dioic acid hydratase in catechol pathway